ncbi:MAG: ArsA family ATPase [Acidimicrobiales bacterium]
MNGGRPDRPVTVCLGAGGVGKTTVAAALGVAAAEAGRTAMVLTIDPAHRLAQILGLDATGLDHEPRLVSGPWPGELWAAMLDPAATFAAAVTAEPGGDQVLRHRLVDLVTTTLSGVNEYMAVERLDQLRQEDRFDRIVVDTPPARHAIDFLDSPGRLIRMIDNRLFGALIASSPRPVGVFRNPLGNAARLMARLVGRVVGSELVGDVVDLFAALNGMADGFRERAARTTALLAGPSTGYTVVSSARREPLDQARWIMEQLRVRQLRTHQLVINRLTPFPPVDPPTTGLVPDPAGDRPGQFGPSDPAGTLTAEDPLARNLAELRWLSAHERALVSEVLDGLRLQDSIADNVVELLERSDAMTNLAQLRSLAGELSQDRSGPTTGG